MEIIEQESAMLERPFFTIILVLILLYTLCIGTHFVIQECSGEDDEEGDCFMIHVGDEEKERAEQQAEGGVVYSYILKSLSSTGNEVPQEQPDIQMYMSTNRTSWRKKKWVLN